MPDVLRNVHFCSGRMLEGLGLGVEGPVLGLGLQISALTTLLTVTSSPIPACVNCPE